MAYNSAYFRRLLLQQQQQPQPEPEPEAAASGDPGTKSRKSNTKS